MTSQDPLDKMTKMSRFGHDDQKMFLLSDWVIVGEYFYPKNVSKTRGKAIKFGTEICNAMTSFNKNTYIS